MAKNKQPLPTRPLTFHGPSDSNTNSIPFRANTHHYYNYHHHYDLPNDHNSNKGAPHLKILLLSFLTVATVAFFVFAMLVSVKQRHRRAKAGARRQAVSAGPKEEGAEEEGKMGNKRRMGMDFERGSGGDGDRRQAGWEGNTERRALLGDGGGARRGRGDDCDSEGGSGGTVSGSMRGVMGMLQGLGGQLAVALEGAKSTRPVWDVESGSGGGVCKYGGGGGSEGRIAGQVDGVASWREPAVRSAPWAGRCGLRKRGSGRLSGSDCLV